MASSSSKACTTIDFEGTDCGDYRIHKLIGKGTFGRVYVATNNKAKLRGGDTFTPTSLAIKCINLGAANYNSTQKRWLDREINILNDPDLKKHPNIVRYVEYFTHENFLCIVMDYYEGGNLYAYIRKRKSIQESAFMEYLDQLSNGLEFLHSKSILHRDVKTKNVLLTAQNDLKLADFGVARKVEEIDLKLTKLVGTPNCMSPEVLNRETYDFKTDIWSLGCVCFEMGCGEYAFLGSSRSAITKKVTSKQLPDFDRLQYSGPIKNMIRKMLEFKPADRPSASEVKTFVSEQKPKTSFDVSNISQQMTKSSLHDSGIVTSERRRSQRTSESCEESAGMSLGSTLSENTGLQRQSANMQAKIVKMIGDHKATKKLERIMRFFNKNPTDYPGLEEKVKDVVGVGLHNKILPFVFALKGMEEGIKRIPGQADDEDDMFSTAHETADNT
ncbi:NIMA (never in mitosis gene a)-related kinase [Mytilus galloprovincialis]|uniref:NIMA (Never in mitosis gene a)-related kinase n=1 Tax=Mytilus galloprovincialis TaxID=29158 RepID=A0A8B6GCU9_MYTGA|nr:NIMA (never in mitosis gene a)-related kinase [Mytilus galloprovincialis]